MKVLSFFIPQHLTLSAALFACALGMSLDAAESVSDKIDSLISSCPYIGLIANEMTYGPITISHLDIDGSGRLVFCEPCERIDGTLKYKIDATKLDSWDFHHIVVGFRDYDVHNCIVHTFGAWSRKGKTSFSFNAPPKKGVYEVCFDYYKANSCNDAVKAWHDHPPSHSTTMGIVVVE